MNISTKLQFDKFTCILIQVISFGRNCFNLLKNPIYKPHLNFRECMFVHKFFIFNFSAVGNVNINLYKCRSNSLCFFLFIMNVPQHLFLQKSYLQHLAVIGPAKYSFLNISLSQISTELQHLAGILIHTCK